MDQEKVHYQFISENYAVSGQIYVEQLETLAKLGFNSIIINRPDKEGGDAQPLSADIIAKAKSLGMNAVYLPVEKGMITPDKIQALADWLEQLEGPILAYCFSGARSTLLYQAAINR
ncbi:TIGR01244 family sulfur transferase [Basilea psittacipulmonis]|uniref:Beta-lactamase hydrolase-like protein phosphatase-like domain-containing protein n=1 Tax=Basilea psittacipulmonis DSM 24701 TaxID=1072685 RepID=A0A077DDV5_9BURK|nr:TIGR01244 family sulfur transferase [Basilea psittacipulmonis]AIL33050.1 hypothetical protein IX83_06775 [Basilea psittacipulmonis DSM 24701]